MVKTLEKQNSIKHELPNGYTELAGALADVALAPCRSDMIPDDRDEIVRRRHVLGTVNYDGLAKLGIVFADKKIKSSKNQ